MSSCCAKCLTACLLFWMFFFNFVLPFDGEIKLYINRWLLTKNCDFTPSFSRYFSHWVKEDCRTRLTGCRQNQVLIHHCNVFILPPCCCFCAVTHQCLFSAPHRRNSELTRRHRVIASAPPEPRLSTEAHSVVDDDDDIDDDKVRYKFSATDWPPGRRGSLSKPGPGRPA